MTYTINTITQTVNPKMLLLSVTGDIGEGIETFDYGLHEDDPYGIAPLLRKMIAEADPAIEVLPYVPPTGLVLRKARLARLADYRWRKEVGGIMVGGTPVLTNDRSKTLISGMYSLAKSEPPEDLRKFLSEDENGLPVFVTMTNAQAIILAEAVGAHVQNCINAFEVVVLAFDDILDGISSEEAADTAMFDALDAAYNDIKGAGIESLQVFTPEGE